MPRTEAPRGGLPPRPQADRAARRRARSGDRSRRQRRQPAHPPRRRCPRGGDAAGRPAPERCGGRRPARLDRPGRGLPRERLGGAQGSQTALGLQGGGEPGAAGGQAGRLGAQSGGHLHPRPPRSRVADAVAGSRTHHPAAPALPGPHRPAAHRRRRRRLPHRRRSGFLRKAGRPPARLAALRRALGPALARCRALRRQRRLREGQAAQRVLLPRLGHQFTQPRPALRPLYRRSARRRSAAARDPGRGHSHRLPAQFDDQRGGRCRPRAVPHGGDVRPHGDRGAEHPRSDHPVRAVPQPQVRSHPAGGLLPAVRLPQQRQRGPAPGLHPGPGGRAHRRAAPAARARAGHAGWRPRLAGAHVSVGG